MSKLFDRYNNNIHVSYYLISIIINYLHSSPSGLSLSTNQFCFKFVLRHHTYYLLVCNNVYYNNVISFCHDDFYFSLGFIMRNYIKLNPFFVLIKGV